MKKKTRLSASGYEYIKKLEEIERKLMNDAINGIPIVDGTQTARSGELDASRIVLRDIRQQEGISQEKRAEHANRIHRTRMDADEPTPVSREKLLSIMRQNSTQTFVSEVLDGRYLLHVPTVKFRYDDFMRIVEDIAKIKDSQLREDIVMKICESQF